MATVKKPLRSVIKKGSGFYTLALQFKAERSDEAQGTLTSVNVGVGTQLPSLMVAYFLAAAASLVPENVASRLAPIERSGCELRHVAHYATKLKLT